MNFKVIKDEGTELKIRFDDIDQGFLNLIKQELWKDPSVDISGFRVTHPVVGVAEFTLKTKKKNAKKAWNDALDSLNKQVEEFKIKFSKL